MRNIYYPEVAIFQLSKEKSDDARRNRRQSTGLSEGYEIQAELPGIHTARACADRNHRRDYHCFTHLILPHQTIKSPDFSGLFIYYLFLFRIFEKSMAGTLNGKVIALLSL